MSKIRNVKLEFLRPGPAHNQLLSPLTPYIALCGGEGLATVFMPFEQRHLLNRLERLRYVTEGKDISSQQRDSEVYELGEILGRILSQVPSLISTLVSARCEVEQLVHLRLASKAYEIALLPFELSIAADGFPGSGSPLFLQSIEPITITREARGRHPVPVDWNRPPRILFAFASPGNLPAVPYQAHLNALRNAIEPWVKYQDQHDERIKEVKKMLTVLPNASLQDIRDACANGQYTYIHILAHGDSFDHQGNTDYGLALCNELDSSKKNIIDGATLAFALTAKDSLDQAQARPTLVSLATCDSGNTGTTIIPGGSIAHALHAAGIPWIVASQFPLWMNASSIATKHLYKGLLCGKDPRWILYNLRQRLRIDCADTHDWASIVTYASVPWDFEKQVNAFKERQKRAIIQILFDKAEKILKSVLSSTSPSIEEHPDFDELKLLYSQIRNEVQEFRKHLSKYASAQEHAEWLGMSAASEKRIGNMYSLQNKDKAARAAYKKACTFYEQALHTEPTNHWVITQYLALRAVLTNSDVEVEELIEELHDWWIAVKQITLWQYNSSSGEDKAWTLGTLLELELLGATYNNRAYSRLKVKKEMKRLCQELLNVPGAGTFPVFSTCRQFKQYPKWCSLGNQNDREDRNEWRLLANYAVKLLGDNDF